MPEVDLFVTVPGLFYLMLILILVGIASGAIADWWRRH
jgi:hypothetical protein